MAETTSTTENIARILRRSRAREAIDAYAWAMAVGVGADDPDPDQAGIVVVCYQRRVYSLMISPAYADPEQIPIENTAVMVNGTLQLAYVLWEEEFYRLKAEAQAAVDELGEQDGAAEIRDRIARNNPNTGTDIEY